MSGLLALLDDVAALTRLASTQIDDIAGQAAKVSTKSAGVVIDDAAVTPKYVTGLPATRELPIIWKIARASFFNKLVILLPVMMLLDTFAPWILTPLLMLGGCYLCYEGAEKIHHAITPGKEHAKKPKSMDEAHLERKRVAGAIKTDFILSAEILTISLNAIEASGVVMRASILAFVAILITAVVYGVVAILVKADDVGLKMAEAGRLGLTRRAGRAIVKGMPHLLQFITVVGTAAMLWVGGNIILHGLDVLGFSVLYDAVHAVAVAAAQAVGTAAGFVEWLVTATLDGIFGLALGFLLIPVVHYAIEPIAGLFGARKAEASSGQ